METIASQPNPGALVWMRIADQVYAISAATVREILPLPELIAVTTGPNLLAGFLNLGGRLVPVVQLSRLLDLPDQEPHLWTPLLLIRTVHQRMALMVDHVTRIVQPNDYVLRPLPPDHVFNDCATDLVEADGETALLLGIERLLLAKETQTLVDLTEREENRLRQVAGQPP